MRLIYQAHCELFWGYLLQCLLMIRDMQNLDLGKIIRLMREENMKGRLLKKKKKKRNHIYFWDTCT